jgi:hypothetical protein
VDVLRRNAVQLEHKLTSVFRALPAGQTSFLDVNDFRSGWKQ